MRRSDLALDVTSGIAEAKIAIAIAQDARGSKPGHFKKWIRIVEMTTATEPKISATIWR